MTGLLPALIRVAADDRSSWRLRSLLRLNENESRDPGPGSDFISTRLLEIILVEILRHESHRVDRDQSSLLAGLSDPITARALAAMHSQVAQKWTVVMLARLCGVSRSTFATHFRRIVGMGLIDYLLRWRLALAKDALRRGQKTIGEVAVSIGFKSSRAFSTAFSKVVGCSPRMYLSRAKANAA